MTREVDKEQDILGIIVFSVCSGTGLREELAMPIAKDIMRALQREYGGQGMYVPMPTRALNEMQILAEVAQGKKKKAVCRDHDISRFQLRRILAKHEARKAG